MQNTTKVSEWIKNDWLKGELTKLGRERSIALASRAALRAIPTVFDRQYWKADPAAEGLRANLTLAACRSVLVIASHPAAELTEQEQQDAQHHLTIVFMDAMEADVFANDLHEMKVGSATTVIERTLTSISVLDATACISLAAAAIIETIHLNSDVFEAMSADVEHELNEQESELDLFLTGVSGLRVEHTSIFVTDTRFDFFRRFLSGEAEGSPVSAELLRRVAKTIPEATWQAGADAVAEAIAEIEALYAAEKALGDLAKEWAAARVEWDRLGIGGNNPPNDIDVVDEFRGSQKIIWEAVDEIAEEVAAEVPDKGRVVRALEAILVCLKWGGRK